MDPSKLLLADQLGTNRIRQIELNIANVSTLLGSGTTRNFLNNNSSGLAKNFSLASPSTIKLDPFNPKFLFTDSDNGRLRELNLNGQVNYVFGSGIGSTNTNGSISTGTQLNNGYPSAAGFAGGFEFVPEGLLFANTSSQVLRFWNRTGSLLNYLGLSSMGADSVHTVAGTAGSSGTTDGTGTVARFNLPNDIVKDSSDNSFYVVDRQNHCLRRVSDTSMVTAVVGLCGTSGSAQGLASIARLNGPLAAARLPDGNIAITEKFNNRIMVWNKSASTVSYGSVSIPSGSVMALVGGASTAEGMPSNASKCTSPGALAVDSQRMCFACTGESNVRCMDFFGPNAWLVYTRAGRPTATSGKGLPRGMEYEGATATSIRLGDVAGLAFDPEGNLVISDNEASLIYKVRLD